MCLRTLAASFKSVRAGGLGLFCLGQTRFSAANSIRQGIHAGSLLFSHKGWVDSETLRQQIRERWGLTEADVKGNGPANMFKIPGAKGTLGFISQMSECFCDRCNRMRLSADGWLRPCLRNELGQIDLRTELRSGVPTAQLRERVAELLMLKPAINYKQRESGTTGVYDRAISQIGG